MTAISGSYRETLHAPVSALGRLLVYGAGERPGRYDLSAFRVPLGR